MQKLIIVAATLTATVMVAGCVTGQAEFAALPGTGKLTQTRLTQAKGYCQMMAQNRVDLYAVTGQSLAAAPGLVDHAKACFASQGIRVTGFRQKDGRLTQSPYMGG
jgi:hypothetical protein